LAFQFLILAWLSAFSAARMGTRERGGWYAWQKEKADCMGKAQTFP